jgi:NADH:ubiquinone oxidoreductase subunit E
MDAISKTLGIKPGETSKDGQFTLEYCQCLGVCEFAPAIMVNDTVYRNLTPGRAATLMEDYQRGDVM